MVKAHVCSKMQSPPEQKYLVLRASGQLDIVSFLLVGPHSWEVTLKIPSCFILLTTVKTLKQCQTTAQESPSQQISNQMAQMELPSAPAAL